MKDEIKKILEKFNKEVEKAELTRNPYSNEDKKFKHILVSLSEEHFNIFKDILDYITNLQEKYDKALTDLVHESHKRIELENKITNLQEENERLLKTQEMYEKKCNNIHNYILQNCEIIRHKDYDEVGKVNGGHILTLLQGEDKDVKD